MTKPIENKRGYKNTPIGWIPKDWDIKPLIELSQSGISNGVFNDPKKVGKGYRLINVIDLYNEPSIDTTKLTRLELTKEEFKNNKVLCGDLLFTRSSLTLEGIAQCNINLEDANDITYDGHVMKISPKSDVVYPPYLRLFCIANQARKFFMSHAKQNTMTTIGQDDISELPVPIPSIPEQKAIICVLSIWDKAIAATQQLIINKDIRKKALAVRLLTGEKRLKGFKDEWKDDILGNLVDLYHGYQFRKEDFVEYGIPVIKIRNVIGASLVLSDLTFVNENRLDEFKDVVIQNGDLLMSLTGNIGRVVEVQGLDRPMFQNYRVGKFVPKNDQLIKIYLKYLLASDVLFYQFNGLANQSAQANFGKQDMDKLKIHIPSSTREQVAIAKVLQTADKELDLLRQKLDTFNKQKKGLMQKLLTGQIRVKHKR